LPEPASEGRDERIDHSRLREQGIQIDPEPSVMTRLEAKVPASGGDDSQERRGARQEIPSGMKGQQRIVAIPMGAGFTRTVRDPAGSPR
jgi:hypothetical protein